MSACRHTRKETGIKWPQTIRTSKTWEAVSRILLFLLLSSTAVPLLFLLLVVSGLLPTQKSKWVKLLMLMIGDRWTSEDLSGPQWISVDLRETQWISVDLRGPQWTSEDLNGSQWISENLSGPQRISEDLSGSQRISVDLSGPQWTWNWATDSLQGQRFTFLAAEDARSGFSDSAFSLLEDLDLLLFSFSTESGESHEGLELLLFLKESGETGGAGLAACGAAPGWQRRWEQTYWFRSRPSSAWIPRSSRGRWRCGPGREAEREQIFEPCWQKAAGGGRQWKASVWCTDSLPVFAILLFLLLFGPTRRCVHVFLLHLPLSAHGPGNWIVGDVVLRAQFKHDRDKKKKKGCPF